jgi:cell division protein FtsL
VVAPAERVRRRLTPAAGVVLTAFVFVTLFAVAISQTLLVQGQIRLDGLDRQLATEQARYQELRKEVAEAESPARVVAAAEALGMVTPQDLVYLQPDASDASDAIEAPEAPDGSGTEVAGAPAAPRGGWSTVKPLLEAPAP